MPDDQGALRDAVDRLEQLLEHDDVALALEPRASTMFIASLSMTSWPGRRSSPSTFGDSDTRSFRPLVKTSTVPSSYCPT